MSKTNHLLQLPLRLDPQHERICIGRILVEEDRFFVSFYPHADASLIIQVQFMSRPFNYHLQLLDVLRCIDAGIGATVTLDSFDVCLQHILRRNTEINQGHGLLLELVSHIWNFLGPWTNGIFVKRAVAYEAGLVHMAPFMVYYHSDRWARVEPLDGEMASASAHRLWSSSSISRVQPVPPAGQDGPPLPIVLGSK